VKLAEFVLKHQPRNYCKPLPKHVALACELLERGHRERKNVILELPPRHMKSELCNVYRPAWWIGEGYVTNRSGVIGNSQDLADKFCQGASREVKLPKDIDRNSEWRLKANKSLDFSYKASGINGQITGWGFDDIVFDDLFKSGMEAKSETKRRSIIDGVVSTCMSRMPDNGILIAMQARLHPGDTIGWLLETSGMQFLRLHLPAVNDDGKSAWIEDQYTGKIMSLPAYESLWPDKYNRAALEAIKKRITPYYWAAQYLQVPTLGDLNFFDVTRCPRYEQWGQILNVVIAVDAAQTETETGAFTAFVCIANVVDTDGTRRLKVVSVRRGRWRPDVMKTELVDFYKAMYRLLGVMPEAVVIERAAGGFALLDIPGMPTVPITPKGDKEERAGSVCWMVNHGNVALPVSAPWLHDFEDELSNFPLTNFKDQVDAFVHGLSFVTRFNIDFDAKNLVLRGTPIQPAGAGLTDREIVRAMLNGDDGSNLDHFKSPLRDFLDDEEKLR